MPEGDSLAARAARAEFYLQQNELAKCVAETQALVHACPELAPVAAPFVAEAQRRIKLVNLFAVCSSEIDSHRLGTRDE